MKHKKFKDITSEDILYFVQDYEELHGHSGKGITSLDELRLLIETTEEKTEGFDLYEVDIENIEYPAIYKLPVHYMKMNGDHPYGVGTSYTREEDKYHMNITLKRLEGSLISTTINVPINESSYSPIKGCTYFTEKEEAIKFLKNLVTFYIKKYLEESNKYKQKALGLKEYKKHIDILY